MRHHLLCVWIALSCFSCGDSKPTKARPEIGAPATSSPKFTENVTAKETTKGVAKNISSKKMEAEVQVDKCPLVVLDPKPPLRVRFGPGSDTEVIGTLENGTIVHSLGRRDGYVRIAEPSGWVFSRMLLRTCDAPPALPAIALGSKTYLLLPYSNRPQPAPGSPLPAPASSEPNLFPMSFSLRDVRSLKAPTPVTLVSMHGSCQRKSTRRVLLVGTCSDKDQTDYSFSQEALELSSCPEMSPREPTEMMVGLIGHHPGARFEEWAHSSQPLSAGQRKVIKRRIQRYIAKFPSDSHPPKMPSSMERFEGSPWAWTYFGEGDSILLFHGDALMGDVDFTAEFPLQIRTKSRLLVGLGGSGHHGYGFYMFPNENRRGLVRESAYPTLTCSPN